MQTFLNHWYMRLLIVLVFIGAIGALVAYAHLALQQAEYANIGPTTISVSGEGEVLATPDIGMFTFAVRAEADTADAAQSDSAERINEIISYLSEQGVADADVKTTNYSLSPKYRYEERVCPANSYCPPGERVVDGYTVSQMVEVKVRDLDMSGTLISGVGERGATNISNLQFTIDDETELNRQARDAAIQNAQENAEKLADSLGVEIVRMIGFYEQDQQPRYQAYGMGGGMDTAEARTTAKMPTGENEFTSTVNITYEIR